MAVAAYEFAGMSSRQGFNRSLRHFQSMSGVVSRFGTYENLADILNELVDDKELETHQIGPAVSALLVGHPRHRYIQRSYNLKESISDFQPIFSQVNKWTAVDMVLIYFHPDLGITLINPKNEQHWAAVQALKKNELVTLHVGAFADKGAERLFKEAMEKLIALLEGRKIKVSPALTKGKFKQKRVKKVPAATKAPRRKRAVSGKRAGRPAALARVEAASPAAAAPPPAPSAARRMTPMYSIPVTNELFHNGNVEAWKRIIESYKAKHPDLEVFIFYEGERIHDINTLFKWGKVKHGSAIVIAVAGENIQDVAKLQRYLKQGASHMFEAFLKFPVNTVLNLF